MRHPILVVLCVAGVAGLAGCQNSADETVERAFQGVNALDGAN